MEKILISACLVGNACRYDGKDNPYPFFEELRKHYDLIPICPEVDGGLPTPRSPSEIVGASVISKEGKDVTKYFRAGADKAVNLAKLFGVKIAILKENSPSCGVRKIHDGQFDGKLVEGEGMTAHALKAIGVKVYSSEDELSFLIPEKKEPVEKSAYKSRREEIKPVRKSEGKAFGKKHSYPKDKKPSYDKSKKPRYKQDNKGKKPYKGNFKKKTYKDK